MQFLILLSQVLPPSTFPGGVRVPISWLKLVSCDLLVVLPKAIIIPLNLNTAQIAIQNLNNYTSVPAKALPTISSCVAPCHQQQSFFHYSTQ